MTHGSSLRRRCAVLLLAAGAMLSTRVSAAANMVQFDWFEYTGRDDIFRTPLPANSYRNPILAGFYPDPSVCRVGDDYYLINSTFAYFPGLPVFHSRDLVHWRQVGDVIDRPGQLDFSRVSVTHGLFAPAISQHDGIYYVVCTMVDGGGNFVVTAKDPAGPWSDPVSLNIDGIDPSLYFAADGHAWLVNNGNPPDNHPLYNGHRAIWIQEFDAATKRLVGPRSIIVNGGADFSQHPVWIEGPHLFERDGWFFLSCAEGGTSDQHSQVIFRSRSATGPFLPWAQNPILTQRDLDGAVPHAVTSTGHADIFPGPDGQWWAVFLGCRPFGGIYTTTGRETFLLPVTWTEDGWPRILPPGERVPYIVAAPRLAVPQAPAAVAPTDNIPLTGNFTLRDDFSAARLSPQWIQLRAPSETWWALGKRGLGLEPRAVPLTGMGNPSFLARRVQHARFDATTSLHPTAETGVSAGLVMFQSEKHYYFAGVRRTGPRWELFVERANGGLPERIASMPIPAVDHLSLRITEEEKTLSFSYSVVADKWEPLLASADVTPVTVQAAGGGLHFTGAVIGPFARVDPSDPERDPRKR